MQRIVRAGRAEVVETALDVIVEEESCLSVARTPAAAAPDTANSETDRNAVSESVANDRDLSVANDRDLRGYGV